MADSLDLLSGNTGLDPAAPVAGADLLAPTNPPGAFSRGFGAGMAGVRGNLAGAGALFAHGVGAVAPVGGVAAGVEKSALDYAAAQEDVAAAQSQSATTVDWTSPTAVAGHLKYLLGAAVPSLALMFAGGALGRGFGALVGKSASAARTGMFAGAVAPDVALEAGGIYPEALKTGVADPATRATVGGAAAASLDFIPLLAAEKYLGAAGRGGFGAVAKGVVKGAPIGAGVEGAQELGQAIIERAAAGQDLTGPQAVADYIDSFLGGAAPGAVFGGAAGGMHGRAAPVAELPTPVPNVGDSQQVPTPEVSPITPVSPPAETPLPVIDGAPGETPLPFIQPDLGAMVPNSGTQLPTPQPVLEQTRVPGESAPVAPPQPSVPSDPAAIRAQIEAQKQTDIANTARALKSVRETHGIPEPNLPDLTNVGRRDVALARADSTARESTASPNVQAQMQAVVPHAMQVVEPMVASIAHAKTRTEAASAKVSAALTKSIRSVVEEAAKQPSVEAAQAHIIEKLPEALKGHGVKTDATDIAKAVSGAVGQAKTQYSRGATKKADYAVVGDTVTAADGGPHGVVQRVVKTSSLPYAVVKWSNGSVGRHTITTIQKVGAESNPALDLTHARWKEGQEYEGRLFGGAYNWNRVDGPRPLAAKDSTMRQAIMQARERYNTIRVEAGLSPVTDWKVRPERGQLVQDVAAPVESNAALTQPEFDALPPDGQAQVMDEYQRIMAQKGQALVSRIEQILGSREGVTVTPFQAKPGEAIGSYTRIAQHKALITLALNAKDGLSVADHEGYHAAEDLLLDSRERQIIARALAVDSPIYQQMMAKVQQYDLQNRTNLADEVAGTPAEARAYAFEFWKRGELQADGALARVWQKIQQFLERIGNAVRGLGFTSMEDIFSSLDRGAFAQRETQAQLEGSGATSNSAAGDQKWYRSALTDAITAMNTKAASAQGWREQIKGLVAKGVVKQAELDAVGLDDWLTIEGTPHAVDEPGFGVVEEAKVGDKWEQADDLGEYFKTEAEANAKAATMKAGGFSGEPDLEVRIGVRPFPNLDFGKMSSAKITKDQVLAFLGQNGVQVSEVMLPTESQPRGTSVERAGDGYKILGTDGVTIAGTIDNTRADRWVVRWNAMAPQAFFTEAAALDAATMVPEGEGAPTKFGQYQLPGGTNYRELLLTLPGKNGKTSISAETQAREEHGYGPDDIIPDDEVDQVNERYHQLVDQQGGAAQFHSPHYDQANILAHIRFNERVDSDGKRVLFVEEFQSDWAQKGKKEGFLNPNGDATVQHLDYMKREAFDRMQEAVTGVGSEPGGAARYKRLTEEWEAAKRRYEEAREFLAKGRIPSAPFVTKTEAWVRLSLNRMIRYAAENGFDRVSWTTGLQQFERWGSEEIAWEKQKGTSVPAWRVHATEQRGGNAGGVDMEGAARARGILKEERGTQVLNKPALKEVISRVLSRGQHNEQSINKITDRVWDRMQAEDAGTSLPRKEGMQDFYDKIVPSVANEVLKKLGGGRVGEVKISLDHDASNNQQHEWDNAAVRAVLARGGEVYVIDRNHHEEGVGSIADLDTHLAELDAPPWGYVLGDKQGTRMQHGFTIAPAMVERIMAGLPLFSRGAVDPSPTGLGDLLATMTPEGRALYSKAAAKADVEIARQVAAGELTDLQIFQRGNQILDNGRQAGADNLYTAALGAAAAQATGGIKHWVHKNINTPNFVASFSKGFKNVYRTLNTFIRYRDDLAERMLIQKIPLWMNAAVEDQNAAFTALNKRNLEGYSKGSLELNTLLQSLGDQNGIRRQMFDQATSMFEGFLNAELASDDVFYKKVYTSAGTYEEEIARRRAQVAELIDKGYMPLRRYGDHTVRVFINATRDGKPQEITAALQFFGNKATADYAAQAYKDEIARSGYDMRVEVGMHYKAQRDASISAQQFLDTARRNGVPLTALETERLVKALSRTDALIRNRMLHREGVPGFSRDGMRVMTEFGMRMSSKLAYAKFAHVIDAALDGRSVDADINSVTGEPAINVDGLRQDAAGNSEAAQAFESRNIWKNEGPMSGPYRAMADQLADYVLVPDHTGQWSKRLRSASMIYFLGGSISSGIVNTMSVPMMVVPQLSIHTDYTNALATTMGAWKTTWQHQGVLRDITKLQAKGEGGDWLHPLSGVDEVQGLREALIAARQYTMDTELHTMMAVSQGQFFSQNQTVQRAMKAWMAPFQITEQTNRITSFIAGYKVGKEKGLTGPALFNFARDMVDATQNSYSEANRPGAARNPYTAILFQFKSFPLFMVEAAALMYKASPKSAIYMLLGLTAMTGVQGLPFAELIEDLIDTIAQNIFNSSFNTRRAMRNVIKSASEAVTGYDASNLVLRGMINEITGISASSRIGAGDFVPGSRLGTADADQGKILSTMLGAPYAMLHDTLANVGGAVSGVAGGDWKATADALRAGGPIALRNVVKGAEQLSDGYASDSKGRKLVDVSGLGAVLQLAGLSSAALAKAYELESINVQVKAFYTQASQHMQNQLVQAMKAGDTEKVQDIMTLRAKWNEANPTMPIMASASATRRDLMLSGLPLDRRSQALWSRRIRGENIFSEQAGQ